MKRIATPMIGGVVTSTLMELLVYPAIFFIWRGRQFAKELGIRSKHLWQTSCDIACPCLNILNL